MAPFNLENNIREKLENRELKPSPNLWKKLESQLEETQPKNKSKTWYYLAASVVGILIVTTVFLTQTKETIEKQVVVENSNNSLKSNAEVVSFPSETLDREVESKENKERKKENTDSANIKPNSSLPESAVDKKIQGSETLANAPDVRKLEFEKSVSPKRVEENEILQAKVEEVVASVKSLQERNSEVTTDEVEMLLRNAQRDIQKGMIVQNSKVDASVLLGEVEWELERSFRDKVFDALGESFNKIRTAVLERND